MDASLHGADLEIPPPLMFDVLTLTRNPGWRTVSGG